MTPISNHSEGGRQDNRRILDSLLTYDEILRFAQNDVIKKRPSAPYSCLNPITGFALAGVTIDTTMISNAMLPINNPVIKLMIGEADS